jgi:hypothetical protein
MESTVMGTGELSIAPPFESPVSQPAKAKAAANKAISAARRLALTPPPPRALHSVPNI